MATKNHWLAGDAAGENLRNPTRANTSFAPTETYKQPRLYRGLPDPAARGEISGYGRNGNVTPASVGVSQAGGADGTGLCDFPTTVDDPVKAALAKQGMADRSGALAKPGLDLERKISSANVPDHPAQGRNRARQSGGVEGFAKAGLPTKLGGTQGQPVRKPQ
jgi:hypothetical protein